MKICFLLVIYSDCVFRRYQTAIVLKWLLVPSFLSTLVSICCIRRVHQQEEVGNILSFLFQSSFLNLLYFQSLFQTLESERSLSHFLGHHADDNDYDDEDDEEDEEDRSEVPKSIKRVAPTKEKEKHPRKKRDDLSSEEEAEEDEDDHSGDNQNESDDGAFAASHGFPDKKGRRKT